MTACSAAAGTPGCEEEKCSRNGLFWILEEVTGGQQSFPAAAAGVITLRDSLGYLGFDPEKTKAVEAKLLAIKNK